MQFSSKIRLDLVLLNISIIILTFHCHSALSKELQKYETRSSISSEINNLNPYSKSKKILPQVRKMLYESLLEWSPVEKKYRAQISKRFTIDYRKKTITFFLEKTKKFWTNQPVTSSHIVNQFKLLKKNEILDQRLRYLLNEFLEDIAAIDSYTIKISFKELTDAGFHLFTSLPIVENLTEKRLFQSDIPILTGSGDWAPLEFVKENYSFTFNDPEHSLTNNALWTHTLYTEEKTNQSVQKITTAYSKSEKVVYELIKKPNPQYLAILWNFRKSQNWSINLRQVIQALTNSHDLCDKDADGYSKNLLSIVGEDSFAKKMHTSQNTARVFNKKNVRIIYNSDHISSKDVASRLRLAISESIENLQLVGLTKDQFVTAISKHTFDGAIIISSQNGWDKTLAQRFLDIEPEGHQNIGYYASPQYDMALHHYRNADSIANRQKSLLKIHKILWQDQPYTALCKKSDQKIWVPLNIDVPKQALDTLVDKL